MCHYNKGKDYIKTAIILSCPGYIESKIYRLPANTSGKNLDLLLIELNKKYPEDFPSINRYDYTITGSKEDCNKPNRKKTVIFKDGRKKIIDPKVQGKDEEVIERMKKLDKNDTIYELFVLTYLDFESLKQLNNNYDALLVLGDRAKFEMKYIYFKGKIYYGECPNIIRDSGNENSFDVIKNLKEEIKQLSNEVYKDIFDMTEKELFERFCNISNNMNKEVKNINSERLIEKFEDKILKNKYII